MHMAAVRRGRSTEMRASVAQTAKHTHPIIILPLNSRPKQKRILECGCALCATLCSFPFLLPSHKDDVASLQTSRASCVDVRVVTIPFFATRGDGKLEMFGSD